MPSLRRSPRISVSPPRPIPASPTPPPPSRSPSPSAPRALMIIACRPWRISIGGGGTDLPCSYRRNGGDLIAVAIDKYIYVTVTEPFFPGIYLKYSALEKVERVADVRHNIMREALRDFLPNGQVPTIEITTLADVPAGTGLGSSSSFTCALLQALSAHWHRFLDRQQLAELACAIEIDRLGAPIG